MKNIKNKYTKDGKSPLIIYGNWNITKQQSGFVPTPNVDLRRKLSKNFKLFLLDEFRTSILSYRTNERMINMKDKATNKKIHQVLILTEKNMNIGCINRDKNAVMNYKKIVDHYIEYGKRHESFKRGCNPPLK